MIWAEICHDGRTQFKIVQGTLNAVKYRDDILDPIVLPFLQQRTFDLVFQHDNARCHVARVCQDFLNQNQIRVLHWPALSPDMSPIEHLWDGLGRRVRHVKIHRKHYRSCVTNLCTSGTTSHTPLSNDWLVLCVGDAKLSLLKEVIIHVTELRKPPYCMTISVSMICSDNDLEKFCWHCLTCYAHMNLNYTIFVDIFLYVKIIEHQILVTFLLLTSIYNVFKKLSIY